VRALCEKRELFTTADIDFQEKIGKQQHPRSAAFTATDTTVLEAVSRLSWSLTALCQSSRLVQP
jgi:hypothetical protein